MDLSCTRGSEDNISEINNELKHIADKLSIGNRIECMKKREAFISLKDHKENFENNPKCRLINPAKSDSGKISKLILDKVNTHLLKDNFKCKPMGKHTKRN